MLAETSIDRAADDMLAEVDLVLAEEKAPTSGDVAHEPRDNRAEEFRRAAATVVLGRSRA